MEPKVESAIAELTSLDERLKRTVDKTPSERINWSPAPSARSPLHLVAHCANSLEFIGKMFLGIPYATATTSEADLEFLEMESKIDSLDEAMALWDAKVAEHIAVLKGLTKDQLDGQVRLPFNLGEAPLAAIVNVGSTHTREHLAQLDYIQTMYGDRQW